MHTHGAGEFSDCDRWWGREDREGNARAPLPIIDLRLVSSPVRTSMMGMSGASAPTDIAGLVCLVVGFGVFQGGC